MKSSVTQKASNRAVKRKEMPKNELGNGKGGKTKMSCHDHLGRQDRRGSNKAAATRKHKG